MAQRILIADDSEEIIEILQILLTGEQLLHCPGQELEA